MVAGSAPGQQAARAARVGLALAHIVGDQQAAEAARQLAARAWCGRTSWPGFSPTNAGGW
jgi:hypothetical protein